MKPECCVIVVAEGIEQAAIDRFSAFLRASLQGAMSIDILFSGAGEPRTGEFNKSKHLNTLLREAIDSYQIIVQTDIDLIMPPKLIPHAISCVANHKGLAYHHVLRHVEPAEIEGVEYKDFPFNEWKKRKFIYCSGCFNAMRSETWKQAKGYCEAMVEWGNEDTEFWNRSKRLGIHWMNDSNFGLVHINHPRRTRRNVEQNKQAGMKYHLKTNWLTGRLVLK